MGIPSYYKKLIDIVPGLVSTSKKDIQWLFMDFNCLIYHCIDDIDSENWETIFIDSIIKYCLKVIKEVNPKTGVFIAIDGVVPMAKMRQQRLRRFKSVWLSKNDKNDKSSTSNKWDKNAITPGTLFMAKLKSSLETMTSKHENWILSVNFTSF
jgi:5'-3' exonuclease